jgi:hypothetical protein
MVLHQPPDLDQRVLRRYRNQQHVIWAMELELRS